LVVLFATRGLAAVEFEFVALGNLRGTDESGKRSSSAHGVSGDGQAVVGKSLSSVGLNVTRGDEAFVWVRPRGMQGLDALPAANATYFSSALDASDQGMVVVGESNTATGKQAFRWSRASGKMVAMGALPRHEESVAYGVSADGKVIVGLSSSPQRKLAFRWTEEQGMKSLGDLPGGRDSSFARAVSRDGKVVVGIGSSERGKEAFRWTAETGMVGLGDLAGGDFESAASGVSRDGSVIVGQSYSDKGKEAFRWTAEDGLIGLGDLSDGELASMAFAVSGDGKTIVGQASGPNGPEAFVWTAEQGMQSLRALLGNNPAAALWRLNEARDVSDDGTIVVGTGLNAQEETAAWLIRSKP
jgi:probable HAF family extracellular repeat protein